MYDLGVDLGGTNIAAAISDQEGNLSGRVSLPTPQTAEGMADRIAEAAGLAAELAGIPLDRVGSIGIGAPGSIDPEAGRILYWSNLGLSDVPLAELVEQRLGRRVYVENDANAAALGEYAAGAGKGSRSMVFLTLGTGVGGAVVLDGKLHTGCNYAAMEVGHMVIERGGRPCTCGRRGCLEMYCSATALICRTREVMAERPDSRLWQLAGSLGRVTGRTAFDAAALGDPAGVELVGEYTDYLGCGVTNLINLFQPDVLCIGGGPSAQGETLLAPVRRILDAEDYARDQKFRTRLVTATLGNDAGIIGAALLRRFR